jgi:hypothetical protein
VLSPAVLLFRILRYPDVTFSAEGGLEHLASNSRRQGKAGSSMPKKYPTLKEFVPGRGYTK